MSKKMYDKASMDGGVDVLRHFKNPLISKKMYDKSPTNEGSDGLRHVEI